MASPPDAAFVRDDPMAFAVMGVLRFELGLRVPHDGAVVGFDDGPPAAWPAHAPITVRRRVGRMMATLPGRIEGGEAGPRRVRTCGAPIVRGSTRAEGGRA